MRIRKRIPDLRLIAILATLLAVLTPSIGNADDNVAGQQIYQQNCVGCHGSDGSGNMRGIPDLTASDSPLKKPEAELVNNVINGVYRSMFGMPPRGGNSSLSDQDIVEVVRYMKATFTR